jgi:uncharacterized repeat protein (TIGR01451 family)
MSIQTSNDCETTNEQGSIRALLMGILMMIIAGAIVLPIFDRRLSWSTHAQSQTQSMPGNSAAETGPPANMQASQANANPSSAGRQVLITFSDLPFYTAVTNQYPDAKFSSDSAHYVLTTPQNYGSSLPNISRAYVNGWWIDGNPPYDHFAPLVIDFPHPVNDVAFHVLASDSLGGIARVDVYQNGNWSAAQPIFGNANPFSPIWYTGISSYQNVSRIVISQIGDSRGLAFDNFSFTVPPAPTPTPTPTPSPTPPAPPTGVTATPDENEIGLSWTPSSDAVSYVIKRTSTAAQSGSAAPEDTTFSQIDSSVSCQPVNGRCFYEDLTANDSGITYSYVIAAANSFGTSPDSNPPANASPLSNACSERDHPTVARPNPGPTGYAGWTMQYDYSANDGLVISEVFLNGKRMAKRMSVPYFKITTTKSGTYFGPTRGELTPSATGTGIRSRLVAYGSPIDEATGKLTVYATYAIDHIPGVPKACLSVSQQYEFYRAGASPADAQGPCEPSDTVHPCNKFRPMIDYTFEGGPGEALSSLNTPIRLHFQNTDATGNTVALTKDLDNKADILPNHSVPFKYVFNPLTQAWWSHVFVQKDNDHPDKLTHTKYDVDNFHQTNNKRRVLLPGADFLWAPPPLPPIIPTSVRLAGCPECVHFHWRWASFTPQANFGYGAPLLPPGSDQAVDIQVNPYKGDEHPNDYYLNVFNPNDWIRNPTKGVNQPYDVVLWYSPTGFAPHDTFFWHTAWFTPIKTDATTTNSIERSSANSTESSSIQDGPVSVDFGALYETGVTTFASYDLSTMPSLPPGFAPLNNNGYRIDTTAVVGGPHVVHFKAESITDQTDFSNLRIFYAEADPFDPEQPMWTDATILSPPPDFSSKTLSARTDDLGIFVIGRLVQTPPALGTANLRLSCTDSQDPITAGNNLTYTLAVTNDGPHTATEVMLRDALSPDVEFVSGTPSQGTCKELNREIYCSLNSLSAGNTATVTVVVTPIEGTVSFPPDGKMIANGAVVRANEIDTDPSNDSVTQGTTVLPSPNHAPSINFTSPISGAMFVGPLNLTLTAQASDSDGSIARVDFYDNDVLIGTSMSGNPYTITAPNVTCGNHSLKAVATDNGGRQNFSTADVIINGSATVSITSPSASAIFTPGSTINLTANVSSSSGIRQVEFFANSGLIGQGSSFTWPNVSAGNYSIVAVATDSSDITTTSAPVKITVGSPPTVAMTLPTNGAIFPSLTNISVSANAHSNTGSITRVDFYADGLLIGSANDVATDKFTLTWRHLADGFHSLTAVATDNLGFSTTSAPITIGVNTPSTQPGEFIWFDDDVPTGAVKHADGDGDWYWVDANPVALSGSKAHQSRNFAELDAPNTSFHQHYFDGATTTLPLGTGDRLFTYVFLDINDMPREIMLQWKDANSWEHRAYWGENRINSGTDGTSSRRYMGLMPEAGQWVRLEVPADQVGLEGSTLTGMSFSLDGGRATWDLAGKVTANYAPPPTTPGGDSVWMEDGLPAGASPSTVNDVWDWVPNLSPYGLAHRSVVSVSHNTPVYRSHSFTGAQTPMQINPGDVLFTYVWIDPAAKPDEIMLQWYDGSSWEHRAFWGENFIGQLSRSLGVQGTESQRYMGGVPLAGTWFRLEIPASYVGLEGKSVSGMAFGLYGKEPTVAWDRSGKRSQLTTIPLTLSPISGVWKLFNKTYGYAYETNDQGAPGHAPTQSTQSFYVHPNQAAGTVPMYRFRRPNSDNLEYFYSQSRSYDGNGWVLDGTAFYVYPNVGTTGTSPLYLYHDNQTHYLLIINQAEATGMALDGIVGYVYSTNGLVPVPPSSPMWDNGCNITWKDNSQNESAFEVYKDAGTWPLSIVPVATLAANVTSFNICPLRPDFYYVRAANSFGHSKWVATCTQCAFSGPPPPPNTTSTVDIVAPTEGEVVSHNFAITANSFDNDGNGTIAKVEFFANGNKLGELSEAPFIFVWNNAAPGTYSLTAMATDSAGATATSSAVSVTVGKSDQTITFDPISAKSYGDAPFTVNATASSGLPVAFTIVSGPATVSGNTVTITGVGSVTVRASQAGDANFNVALDVDRSFNVAKGSATIALSNLSQTYDGTAKPVTATTNPVGLSGLSITYNGSGSAPTNVGGYSVVASLANDNYSASDASGILAIGKASQTITFDQPANKTYGDASFGVSASSSSGLPLSFSIISGPATIVGSTVSLNGAGTVTVRASQSGNANYNAANDVDRSFSVAKASATITLTNLNQNYDGTAKAATATTSPAGLTGVSIKYNGFSTAPSNAGSYSVVASLTNDNYAATDATGTLIINALPTVSISSPSTGALLHATSVTISASAADSDGTVSKVEFFQGSTKLGQVLSAPFSFVWNNVAGGSYSLTAVATDNSGASKVSSPVSITVNNPPNVSVTASSPQDIPTAPAQFSINAEASDADGTISKVDFYQGTTLLATDVTSPYSYTWSNVAAGNYSITAKATDNLGGVTTSNVVGVSVNAKPNVSLASPANGASFFAPALVSLTATASDSDGSVSKVEFYQGSTLISTVTATPYSFNWSYVPAGTYALTAKATDNNGASTISNSVSITVTPSSVAIGKIAFASNRDGWDQIYLMNTDGTSQTCLSNGAYNDESPKWSPDNSHIAFQSDRDFQNDGDSPIYGMDIYIMNWDGSGVSRLTSSTYDDINPVWSPDGTKIAFQSFRNGLNYQIYVMNADGSGQVNISNNNANETQPSWSPDGTKIAFASDRDQAGFSSIYVMSANGSNQTRVTLSGTGLLDEQPAWSPDGMKLAFITTRDSTVVTWDEWLQGQLVVKTKLLINKEVYVMNADGSSQIRLTNIMGNDDSPVWSPDGTRIAFRSDRDRNCCDPSEQIWMMNGDGSNQVNLSNNQFGDHCPSWSR